jgi:cardiolipin synthase A/B
MPQSMVGGNRVELLHGPEVCLPTMMEVIRGARQEIVLEMYWFASDATGQSFARALSERAQEGVRVCVTYDAVGSFEADRGMFERMRKAGCDVYEYNPVNLGSGDFTFGGLNRRNHRKMLIADGRIGMTGGVNLGDAWASHRDGGLGFRDDMISIEGPAARVMREIFFGTFRGPTRDVAVAAQVGSDEPVGSSRVRVLANDSFRHRRLIERAYLRRIRTARERILITNSYFIPRRVVRHALAQAARRGVQVCVLVPTESDVPVVTYATHRLYSYMLERGIEIYEWTQGILHSKTAAVDGQWCTVGTHNIDHRSWAYNLEVNVAVEDPSVARRLETRMEQDMAASRKVDAYEWRFRPLGARVLEEVFYRMRKLL